MTEDDARIRHPRAVDLSDVRVGATYLVVVPRNPGDDDEEWVPMLWLLKGSEFRMTITGIDRSVPPAVEGLRIVESTRAAIELTDDQVDALGLPPGRYTLTGDIGTSEGRRVAVPELRQVRVPPAWLTSADPD